MFVTKRNGNEEEVQFDKITERISKLIKPDESKYINAILVGQKVVAYIHTGITTEELDIVSADRCINLSTTHPLYSNLGGRILVSNLHKKTSDSFSETVITVQKELEFYDPQFYDFVINNSKELNDMIDHERDYMFDYFGFKTIERAYLIKNPKTKFIFERPQYMYLRLAASLHMNDIKMIKSTYDMMSQGLYTHASPTLFNSASKRPQLSSCFLIGTDDSIEGITDTWKSVSMISKWGGGIGLHVSNIRSRNSIIRGTQGPSSGIIPMLQVYNNIARYINQGGKRKGSIAIYLEPHHDDIFEFLDLRKNFGDENMRARDLFSSLWVSDLFMKQVESDSEWYLMCPDECKGLTDVWGKEYEDLYWSYVDKGMFRRKIKARKLMSAIWEAQQETGTPYITYKDSVNRKSNQMNIGTIKSSNLCNEIVEYSDHNEHAVCNLASIALNKMLKPYNFDTKEFIVYTKPECKFCKWSKKMLDNNNANYTEIIFDSDTIDSISGTNSVINNIYTLIKETDGELESDKITFPQIFVKENDKTTYIGGFTELYKTTVPSYDFEKLHQVAYCACMNLNKIIDLNFYPTHQTERSNMKHRPIGLGIQGLADTLALMRIPFETEDALQLNRDIMETIYHASLQASNDKSKSRCEDMKSLVKTINEFNFTVPEFYRKDTVLDNQKANVLYHKLRPNTYELNRDPDDLIGSYSSFVGSPASKGQLQFDMWGLDYRKPNTGRYNWLDIKDKIIKYGLRNSLLVALMPTASTSQILGNNECFEYFTSNIYTRNTLAGDFPIINKHLVNDLISIGEWSTEIKDFMIAANGSIQHMNFLPNQILEQYKTQWEIKQLWVLKAAKERGPYVDQTQSMNIFLDEPNDSKLNSCLFWGWKNGLKTGMYYLRSKPSGDAIKVTVDPKLIAKVKSYNLEPCDMCSA